VICSPREASGQIQYEVFVRDNFFLKRTAVYLYNPDLQSFVTILNLCFSWMIGPTEPQDFYTSYWEKKPLHIKRGDPTYYKDVFSCKGGTVSSLLDFFYV
jgi:hypothetical protein